MKGERCAERPGTGMMLWLHEYYLVVVEKYNGGVPKPDVYQALKFSRGFDLPAAGCDLGVRSGICMLQRSTYENRADGRKDIYFTQTLTT